MQNKEKEMKQIALELTNLTASPLFSYRTSNSYFPVIGEGSLDSKIMFIGEAPGKNEAKTGRPFCGAAGKLLDKFLQNAGILRERVYITNIVKDRPPENRDPSKKEIEVYGPLLDKQIEIIKPKVIATLGRYAMKYVMTKFGLEDKIVPIGKAHGNIFETKTSYGDLKIAVLYHPCVGIYNPRKIPDLMKEYEILGSFE